MRLLLTATPIALLALATAVVIRLSAPASPAATAASAAPALRDFTLIAQETDWDLMPGTTVKGWTYNGVMPGPELRVNEGDLLRITLVNQLPEPTTIHWHGVDVPPHMDGVPGISQLAVPPGGSFVYEFIATNPGTRWYHSHQDPEVQVHLGLYGALIIEPKVSPTVQPKYDREYTYILNEWSLAMTPAVATGAESLPLIGQGAPHSKQADFDLFLINGKIHDSIPPLSFKRGERIRVRLINAGSLVHTIHPHGHSFKIIATDGNPVPAAAQLTKDSVTIGPSERYDLEFVASNPGVWAFHCHMEHHMANGMMTTIRYEGTAPAVSGGHDHTTALPAASAPVNAVYVSAADVTTSNRAAMTDNRYTPGALTVPIGATVAWLNNGTNLHTATAFDGSFESGSIPAGKAWTFTFTRPGAYQFFCRQHLLNGMTGVITVQ